MLVLICAKDLGVPSFSPTASPLKRCLDNTRSRANNKGSESHFVSLIGTFLPNVPAKRLEFRPNRSPKM